MAVLAMFPLGSVLLPGQLLPLQVFEPRYLALVRDCVADPPPEFGVVLIERGSEVGGGDTRFDVGTVARIIGVEQLDGGRWAVVAVGVRRVRVNAWLPDDPYPLADVDDWPDDWPGGSGDEPDGLAERLSQTVSTVRRLCALARELGDPVADATQPIAEDLSLATFQLAGLAPLGPSDRLQLLAAQGPRERLDTLAELLVDAESVLQFRLGGV